MQINTDRTGAVKVKLTKTETQTLTKAAGLLRTIGYNVHGAGVEFGKAADVVANAALAYGPKEESAASK
jgi:hypothetical protein